MTVKGIELNNLPLVGIEFSFNSKGITISCNHHNEDAKEEDLLKIYFHGVKNIFTSQMEIGDETEIRISEVEYEEESETKKARFHFRTDSPNPEITLTFNYATVLYSW